MRPWWSYKHTVHLHLLRIHSVLGVPRVPINGKHWEVTANPGDGFSESRPGEDVNGRKW